VKRRRRNDLGIVPILIGTGAAAVGLVVSQIAASKGLVPTSIQQSPMKSAVLFAGLGLGGGLLAYMVSPAAGVGLGAGVGGFGIYMAIENALNAPPASAKPKPGTNLPAIAPTTPVAPVDPITAAMLSGGDAANDPMGDAAAALFSTVPDGTDPSSGDGNVATNADQAALGAVVMRRLGAIVPRRSRIAGLYGRSMYGVGAVVADGFHG
jgi:hypothetical protein